MEADERITTLEEEFKLIKGELKQTLSSVREYLMETGLPDSEYSTIIAAMAAGGGETQKIEMRGDLSMPKKEPPPDDEEEIVEELEEMPEDNASPGKEESDGSDTGDSADSEAVEDSEDIEDSGGIEDPEDSKIDTDAYENMEEETGEAAGEEMDGVTGEGLAEEEPMTAGLMEQQADYRKMGRLIARDTPRVNLLANLIRWVASARRELGAEQLATFLEVYGICGHLTPELKEVIMRLSDVAQPQSEEASAADVWSQLLLELHGILTGADAPVHPVRPMWSDGKTAEAEAAAAKSPAPKDETMKLKLVLSDSEGKDREFNLNLAPAPEEKKPKTTRK